MPSATWSRPCGQETGLHLGQRLALPQLPDAEEPLRPLPHTVQRGDDRPLLRPRGYSEHQTGLALDVIAPGGTLNGFKNTQQFVWMRDNAHRFGFILRYGDGMEYITGYKFEPWHYRYVGVDAATFIYENDLTFEEYYAYYVKK